MCFNSYLTSLTQEFTPVVANYSIKEYTGIELSIHQKALKELDTSSAQIVQAYIEAYVLTKNKKVAFGGYLEVRNLYARSTYFTSDKENSRNIHLGIDIWCPANTPVLLPLNGNIHSFNITFYTLYGHLTQNSLNGIQVGDEMKQGAVLGYLGDASVNGDYAPHLHFQIIKDLEGNKGDYPGVCAAKDLAYYTENCPNPNLLLKLPA